MRSRHSRDEQIARETLDRRTQLIADTTVAQSAVTENGKTVADLESAQGDKDSDFDRFQKALEEKQSASRSMLVRRSKAAAKTLAKARARAELSDLTRRLEAIREHDEKKSRAQATIESITVTTKDVEKLSSLETEVRIAEHAKTSAASQIEAKQLGTRALNIDGTELGEGNSGEFAALKDVRIMIDGIADITVRPGASPVELDKALTSAKRAFEAELERLDIDSVSQARDKANVRADAEAVMAEADSTLKVLLGQDKRDKLEAALARAQQILGADGTSASTDDKAGNGAEVDGQTRDRSLSELETAVAESEATVDDAQSAVDSTRIELERTRTSRDDARVETVRAQTSLKEAETQHERLTSSLAEARKYEF